MRRLHIQMFVNGGRVESGVVTVPDYLRVEAVMEMLMNQLREDYPESEHDEIIVRGTHREMTPG